MTRTRNWIAALLVWLVVVPGGAALALEEGLYKETTQADLVADREGFQEKKVQVTGVFLFTGSDFCYQIRKTKINTRDYFCFALGTPSLVRMYLKKDHPQADALLGLEKGATVQAYGTFDFVGSNYNFMVVDEIAVEPAG